MLKNFFNLFRNIFGKLSSNGKDLNSEKPGDETPTEKGKAEGESRKFFGFKSKKLSPSELAALEKAQSKFIGRKPREIPPVLYLQATASHTARPAAAHANPNHAKSAQPNPFPLTQQEPIELTRGYGDDRLVMMVRHPWWVFTYWELTPQRIQQGMQNYLPGTPLRTVLRLHDVTSLYFVGNNSHLYRDFEMQIEAGNYYLGIWEPDRDYLCELGFMDPQGRQLLPFYISYRHAIRAKAPRGALAFGLARRERASATRCTKNTLASPAKPCWVQTAIPPRPVAWAC